ncbi:MAG: UDP-4-amino-4,6-dideoxy-N-acetyl-beta-L-altrosamine transaminase [Candidatus Riflebacteria bacterium]|nr:UDP-4-amino-4,6-dideoxy-N-acetyl-beta-L-altrosamine transaminase [Candidatus Riflebacteria bacterium]
MDTFIPYGHQNITEEDIEAVSKVLKANYITQGPVVEEFEKAVCNKIGSKYGVCCTNGTSALHLAMIAAGVNKNDRIIAPAMTFCASANCARFLGAEVLFADIDDRTTITMSVESCKELLEKSRLAGKPVKAVVTVDMAGNICDMEAFAKLKKEYDFIWVEDSCHAIGGSWTSSDGKVYRVGEYPEVDMTVFSFHPVKHITTGEGGMVVTHSEKYAKSLRFYRSHGMTKIPELFKCKEEAFDKNGLVNPWYYEMQDLGFNYRMTEMQAALGLSQLKRLESGIKRRREIVDYYRKELANCPLISFPLVDKNKIGHAYHLAIMLIDFEKAGMTRAAFMNKLASIGIGTQVHYIPVPMLPYYVDKLHGEQFPNAIKYYRKCLSFPCFPSLTDADLDRVVRGIKQLLGS